MFIDQGDNTGWHGPHSHHHYFVGGNDSSNAAAMAGNCWSGNRFVGMTPVTEHDVAEAASFMGYDLWRGPRGYLLKRQWHNEEEIVEVLFGVQF